MNSRLDAPCPPIYSHVVRVPHTISRVLALLGVVLSHAACSGTPEPTIAVHICGDLVVPDEVDAVRLSILDPDRNLVWTSLDELTTSVEDAARFDFALGEAGAPPIPLGDGGTDGGTDGEVDAAPVEPLDAGVGDGGAPWCLR